MIGRNSEINTTLDDYGVFVKCLLKQNIGFGLWALAMLWPVSLSYAVACEP